MHKLVETISISFCEGIKTTVLPQPLGIDINMAHLCSRALLVHNTSGTQAEKLLRAKFTIMISRSVTPIALACCCSCCSWPGVSLVRLLELLFL